MIATEPLRHHHLKDEPVNIQEIASQSADAATGHTSASLGALPADANIWEMCRVGNLERVEELTRLWPQLVSLPEPPDNVPPLHWAALNGNLSVSRLLLSRGAAVNAVGGENWSTALQWAATKGNLQMASLLLQYGADLSLKDQPGYTALHVAAQHGQTLVLLYLLAVGVPVDERDSFGRTALLWAAYRGQEETAQVLLQEGADPSAADNSGTSILQWAIIKGHRAIVRLLLQHQADTSHQDCEGRTAIDWAHKKDQTGWFFDLLIESGKRASIKGQLSPLDILYWRMSGGARKVALGKVCPVILLSTSWLLLWKTSPWMLGLGLAVAFNWLFDRFLRTSLFPSLLPIQVGMVNSYQIFIAIVALFMEFALFYEATGSTHAWIHYGWWISFAATMYYLRKSTVSDPGKIKAPLPDCSREAHHRMIVEMVAEDSFNRRKYCVSCRIRKPLRSKHCRICDVCIARFDHHCPWTNNCVGVGNHRPFIAYVYTVVTSLVFYLLLCISYLQTVSTEGVVPSVYCLLGQTWCKRTAAAPFVFIFAAQTAFFISWVAFLLFAQTFQILRNKTTNEMSNSHRLEYFMATDTAAAEHESEAEHIAAKSTGHKHGPSCNHSRQPKTVNPFDKGALFNCTEFCLGTHDRAYYEMHQLPDAQTVAAAVSPPQVSSHSIIKMDGLASHHSQCHRQHKIDESSDNRRDMLMQERVPLTLPRQPQV